MTMLKSLAQSVMLGASDPDALLVSAVKTGIGELGGWMPLTLEGIKDSCPPETSPQMTERAGGMLKRMINGEFDAVLPEFLQLAAARGRIAPPETLPALLGLGKKELRLLVLPVLGERGRWLAGYNPAWGYALAPVTEADWETGSLAQRISLLENLRATAPHKARELVQATWEADPPEARAVFLATFAIGLNIQDEALLDACLDDKRKEVREVALSLLARLPESRLVTRIAARLEPFMRLKSKFLGGDALEVSLPEKLDADMKRDGVGTAMLRKGLGAKANTLAQMLALVPPSVWSRKWNRTPEKLIQIALGSEWQEALLLGWMLATERSADPQWAAALAEAALKQTEARKALQGDDLARLAHHIKMEKLESLVSFTPLINELDDKNPCLDLLEATPHTWSTKLARTVMGSLRRQAGGAHWRLMRALPGFALRIPPALADEFAAGWPATEKARGWETWIEQFNVLMNFRKEMMDSL
jgi:hypothetical protein